MNHAEFLYIFYRGIPLAYRVTHKISGGKLSL